MLSIPDTAQSNSILHLRFVDLIICFVKCVVWLGTGLTFLLQYLTILYAMIVLFIVSKNYLVLGMPDVSSGWQKRSCRFSSSR